jgi:hypothetical protein
MSDNTIWLFAGAPKSYWLIVPAASQAVEVLPGQVVMMYPAVQPQLLFAAGTSHAPVMTRLASGKLQHTFRCIWVQGFLGLLVAAICSGHQPCPCHNATCFG